MKLTEASNEWRGSGILEYRNGVLSFLQTGTTLTNNEFLSNEKVRTGIYRYTPSTGDQELVLAFPTPISGTGVDLDNFVYSTRTDQWCGHQEGSNGRNLIVEMDGMQEPIFCFSATSSLNLTPPPPPASSTASSPVVEAASTPTLAKTGVDLALIPGLLALSLGLIGVIALTASKRFRKISN
jgi:hypothetical protein